MCLLGLPWGLELGIKGKSRRRRYLSMICPICQRRVPKLIGTDHVCPDCFLATAEDLIPSVFRELEDEFAQHLDAPHEGWMDSPPEWCAGGFAAEASGGLDDDLADDGNPIDDSPPTFQGRRRF